MKVLIKLTLHLFMSSTNSENWADYQVWTPFTMNELEECLHTCSNTSAPGPDHLMWQHLKSIVMDDDCANLFLRLGNACISTGFWPDIFKESMSVIILKLGKP
jgi:hypothetical protein